MHMSFSSEPSQLFLVKLVTWLRQEINPYTLVTVGLQPNIGAGCILRSLNKYFDLSLRQSLVEHKSKLAALLDPSQVKVADQTAQAPVSNEKPQNQEQPAQDAAPQGAAA
jgi:hypothetical protein